MDELLRHCLRELAFDGDLGKFFRLFFFMSSPKQGSNPLDGSLRCMSH